MNYNPVFMSGTLNMLVVDVGRCFDIRLSVQTRLASKARHHNTAVLLMTEKPSAQASAGSLVSLRIETSVRRVGFDKFDSTVRALKDKHRGPGWAYTEDHGGCQQAGRQPGLHFHLAQVTDTIALNGVPLHGNRPGRRR
mgnify:CR=1 FL=1